MAATKNITKFDVLQALRDAGVPDADVTRVGRAKTAADAKSIVEGLGLELAGVDLDAAWQTKRVSVRADAGEEVVIEPSGDSDDVTDEMEAMPKRAAVPAGKVRAAGVRTSSSVTFAEKQYDRDCQKGWTHAGGRMVRTLASNGEHAMIRSSQLLLAMSRAPGAGIEPKAVQQAKEILKAHGIQNNELGGNLVPTEYVNNIINNSENYGAFPRAVGIMTTDRNSVEIPRVNTGVTVTDYAENATLTAQDDPKFGLVRLELSQKGAYLRVPNTLIRMADVNPSLSDVVGDRFSAGFGRFLDQRALLGTGGRSEPLFGAQATSAFRTAGVDVFDAALTTTNFTAITVAQIESWLSLIPTSAFQNGGAGIICSRVFFGSVFSRFGMSAGGIVPNQFFSQTTPRGGIDGQYNGYPVYFSDVCPTAYTADHVVAVAGGWASGCKIAANTASFELSTSEHVHFAENQTAFRALWNFGYVNHDVGSTNPLSAPQSGSQLIGFQV